jgi:primosomal protein N' (replication factor Y)
LHADKGVLYCHTCGATEKIPFTCPECKNPDIIHKGFGTKLLEQEIKKRFPKARVARFDADNTKEETLNENYDEVKAGKIDIVIGTQVLAKGLDLPNLKTVGVVQADAGLALPDFAAEERTFALLTQVLGRIGRGHQECSAAIIQTFQPDSTTVKAAIAQDYVTFYNETLKVRRKAGFPPYCHLLRIAVTYKTEAATLKHIREIYKALVKNPRITVLQPTPAFHERTGRGFTWQLVVKATSRAELVKVVGDLPTIAGVHITLDPPSLL